MKAEVVKEQETRLSRASILWVLGVCLLVVLLDQITKQMVLANIRHGQLIAVIPGLFNLTLHFNPGAAFGFMADLSDGWRQLALGATTAIALGFVLYFLIKEYFADRIGQTALAMILGGALGNLIDRLVIGEVVDFLDFFVSNWHWPAFNLADSAICLGVVILLIRQPKRRQAGA